MSSFTFYSSHSSPVVHMLHTPARAESALRPSAVPFLQPPPHVLALVQPAPVPAADNMPRTVPAVDSTLHSPQPPELQSESESRTAAVAVAESVLQSVAVPAPVH